MMSNSLSLLFDKFEVLETLKKDTHTSVYLANQTFLGKKIILKTLDKSNLSDDTILSRFKREAKILAKLDHPNIIKVLDFGTYEQNFYISFEFFESQNLREIIKTNKLSISKKKELYIQLLEGLSAAHSNQIIHRDIKPENILVNAKNELKIADFGLAFAENDTVVTNKSSILGTPSYMSPEQIRGEQLTIQSDLFSAGIVMYELFTGKNPFLKNDLSSTINYILNYDESSLSDLSQLADELQRSILGLLCKNKNNRFKNSEEVLRLLKPYDSLNSVEVQKIEKNKTRFQLMIILMFVLFVAGFFIFNTFMKKNSNINHELKNEQTNPITENKTGINSGTIPATEKQITVEKQKDTEKEKEKNNSFTTTDEKLPVLSPAKIMVECSPWAIVYIDSIKIDSTPLKEFYNVQSGRHEIKLVHPDFPAFIKIINLSSNEVFNLKVNLENEFGKIDFQIYPWGEVYIDGKFFGQTPIQKQIMLTPGTHLIRLKNPAYSEFSEKILVKQGEKMIYKYNFENSNQK